MTKTVRYTVVHVLTVSYNPLTKCQKFTFSKRCGLQTRYHFIVMNTVTSCPRFTAAGFEIHMAENNSILGWGPQNVLNAEKFKYMQIKGCCDSNASETGRISYLITP